MSEFEFWKDIGNISDAILSYQKKNAEFNNRFINPWIQLGNLIDREDRNVEILQAYQHATEIDPGTARNWIDLADTQLKTGAYEEAVIAYRKAAELAPQAGWLVSNLALALVMQGKYEEAIPLYADSIELLTEDKDRAISWNRLGDLYRKINDYEKAFLSFQKADELEGKYIRPIGQVDAPSQELPNPESEEIRAPEVDEQPQENETDDDDDPLTKFEKLFVQITQPDPEPVAVSNDPVTEEDDDDLPSWLSEEHKSKLTSPANDTKSKRIPEWLSIKTAPDNVVQEEDAIQDAGDAAVSEKEVEEIPDQLNGQNEADDEEQETVIVEESIRFVEEVAAKNFFVDVSEEQANETAYEEYLKDVVEPMTILSDHVDEINSQAIAGPNSETLMAMETKNAQVWNELGNVYMKSGAVDDAIASYSKAIELERHFAWPYSNLALAYVQKGYLAEAILLYQRGIELFTADKDKAITWNRLGNVYRRMNDYDNAIAAYQTADELDPENATLSLRSSFGLLGNLYAEQKINYVS